jgi:hypothetical protein
MTHTEFEGQIPFFLQNFLSRPATSIPKGGQWVLVFEGTDDRYTDQTSTPSSPKNDVIPIQAIIKGTKFEPKQWDIEKAIATTLYTDFQEKKGCMFVQAVQIPGEANQVNPEGLQQSGYIRTFTGAGRDAFQNLQISFLETNISFADNVIRPWVIATSHLGMIARSGPLNYRCNISIYKLGVLSQETSPYVAQKYTFYGACPISVTGEEYNYTQTTSPVNREATFVYHYYTVTTDATNLSINYQQLELQREKSVIQSSINRDQNTINNLRNSGNNRDILRALNLETQNKRRQKEITTIDTELNSFQQRLGRIESTQQ